MKKLSIVLALIMVVNAGYGGGFSNVPTLLSDHYGMSNISAIHGITLSAWAFAGLTGNQMVIYVDKETGVNYLYAAAGYGAGLTPLLNADGRPVVTPISQLMEDK